MAGKTRINLLLILNKKEVSRHTLNAPLIIDFQLCDARYWINELVICISWS